MISGGLTGSGDLKNTFLGILFLYFPTSGVFFCLFELLVEDHECFQRVVEFGYLKKEGCGFYTKG